MAFDADAYVEALEKPSITIGGETHEGKILSFTQAVEFASRFDDLAGGEDVPVSRVADLAKEVFTRVYGEDVTAEILELPAGGLLEALEDFLACQLEDHAENGKSPKKKS